MFRVCHILSGDRWAGAEVMAYHLLKGLKQYTDIDLCVILLNPGKLADELEKADVRVVVLDEKYLPFYRILLQIKRFFTSNPPHVVHSHRYKENLLAYLAADTKHGCRLFATQHGMPEFVGRSASLKYRLIASANFFLLSRRFHKLIAVANDIKRILISEWKLSDTKIETIPNGIPINGCAGRRDSADFVIGSCGRLVAVKDFAFMVEIAREVAARSDRIRFELAGDGPDHDSLKALINRYGLQDRFLLRGFVEDMDLFYSGLDLYLNTSTHEGMPISILEAMAHSIPVIAPAVGGLGEIVQSGVEGYLIADHDAKAFAEKCLELSSSATLRRDMASAARIKARGHFSVDEMIRRYYRVYVDEAQCSQRAESLVAAEPEKL